MAARQPHAAPSTLLMPEAQARSRRGPERAAAERHACATLPPSITGSSATYQARTSNAQQASSTAPPPTAHSSTTPQDAMWVPPPTRLPPTIRVTPEVRHHGPESGQPATRPVLAHHRMWQPPSSTAPPLGGMFPGGATGGASSSTAPRPAPRAQASPHTVPPPGPAATAAAVAAATAADDEYARRLQQEFDREVAAKEAKERFDCPLCLETARLEHAVELDCLHRICRECFTGYLEVKIREKRVATDELVCPMPSCGCEVTVPQVEGATRGTPLWERFLGSRVELWRPENRQIERLCECPVPSCQGFRFVVHAALPEVRCPQCQHIFCPICRERHPGTTCEAFAAKQKAEGPVDEDFEALVKQQCWQRCPCCSAVCERPHGCNFMTCYSEQCRGKKYFCYLCGCELTSMQHFTHFPHGLFVNACENVDRRDDKNLPQASWGTAEWWGAVLADVKTWALGYTYT